MKSKVAELIKEKAEDVYKDITKKRAPELDMPLRALSNVKYDEKEGYFEITGKKKNRTLTVGTIKTFAQTLRMMALSKELVEQDDIATKREAYYVSKNWGDARFITQPESDTVMDDIESMMMVNREQIGFIPEEKGGDIAGRLVLIDKDPETGKEVELGQPGEICVKGPQVMIGYFNKPEETKKTIDADGYLHTGDVAVQDENGYLSIVDRTKDMIIVGGFKVFSKKVEEVLTGHPAVEMIAMVGLPNPERPGSELVKAFVTPTKEYENKNYK